MPTFTTKREPGAEVKAVAPTALQSTEPQRTSLLSMKGMSHGADTLHYGCSPLQRRVMSASEIGGGNAIRDVAVGEARSYKTSLPPKLQSGIQALSGLNLDGVNVHYNSSKPAGINALAYAQGSDIHLGPGQEKYLPHEAWHVVQQAQGRVQPTMQMKGGISINGDKSLEHEADVMGAKALQSTTRESGGEVHAQEALPGNVVQRVIGNTAKIGDIVISMSGAQWIITKVEGDEESGYRYTVEQIGGRPVLWNPRTVTADDPAWNLVHDEPELSEGYSDSEDIDSPSEGESVDLHRSTTGETIRTRLQTPHSSELRSARHIRDMRSKRTPRHSGPFLTKFGDSHFEFNPTPIRKDFGVTPVVPSEKGGYARNGSARQYPIVAKDMDDDIKRTGATEAELNRCLEYILRINSDASLEELQEAFCKTLDAETLEHLRELAAILRLDQARSKNSRSVIDEEVFGDETLFQQRFGAPGSKKSPGYRGSRATARHGGLGGVQSLRQSDSSKYAPKKRKKEDEPSLSSSTGSSITFQTNEMSDEHLLDYVDRALKRRQRWAVEITERHRGNADEIIEAVRDGISRLTLLPDGRVFAHLRGG